MLSTYHCVWLVTGVQVNVYVIVLVPIIQYKKCLCKAGRIESSGGPSCCYFVDVVYLLGVHHLPLWNKNGKFLVRLCSPLGFVAALLAINSVFCSHPCFTLLGRETRRRKRARHPQAPHGGMVAADRLRGLHQEQRPLIGLLPVGKPGCQFISTSAFSSICICNLNLTVFFHAALAHAFKRLPRAAWVQRASRRTRRI
jgi:hypothetical protein